MIWISIPGIVVTQKQVEDIEYWESEDQEDRAKERPQTEGFRGSN
jgi:hypothetical protein